MTAAAPPMPDRSRWWLAGCLLLIAVVSLLDPRAARAHFDLEDNLRIIHVAHTRDGLEVHVRLPGPYVVARATPDEPDRFDDALTPYIEMDAAEGRTLHRFADGAAEAASDVIAEIVASGHQLRAGGQRLLPERVEARVHLTDDAPAFSTLAEARAAFAAPYAPEEVDAALVGDTVVDAVMVLPASGAVLDYTFGSDLDPGLRGQDNTMNLLADHLSGATQLYQAAGTLATPIAVSRTPVASLPGFVRQGMRSMLLGLGSGLFVLCLVLGAGSVSGLLWRLGGFTLGHSLALWLAVFGAVALAPWVVSAGIALSVIVAATLALSPPRAQDSTGRRWLIVAGVLGIVHGLGFATDAIADLAMEARAAWQGLLAFNLGIELGQILIVLVIWPLSHLVLAGAGPVGDRARQGILLGSIAIAMVLIFQAFTASGGV